MKLVKFRPCLTSKQITHVLSLCKKDLSEDSLSVISVLAPFKAKVESGGINPAYTMQKREPISSSLGIEVNEEYANLTSPERRQFAYNKWLENPDSCNSYELDLVQAYRSLNGLMSPEEKEQYDKDMEAHFWAAMNRGGS